MKPLLNHPLLSKLMPENRQRTALWIFAVIFAGVLSFLLDRNSQEREPAKPEAESPESAATFIPEGFVLVPIEVANYESLDSILGNFGVVDLYSGGLDPGQRPIKVASRVKILRAPLNPNHFAVLAPEAESQRLLGFSGPLTVVVQNPNSSGTRIVNRDPTNSKAPKAQRKISRVTIEVKSAEGSEVEN
jgi:hypothetical protein